MKKLRIGLAAVAAATLLVGGIATATNHEYKHEKPCPTISVESSDLKVYTTPKPEKCETPSPTVTPTPTATPVVTPEVTPTPQVTPTPVVVTSTVKVPAVLPQTGGTGKARP